VIGVNIGKNKVTPQDKAVGDYVACTKALARYADYLVVNVSSPNTPGLRGLQERSFLEPILAGVFQHAEDTPVLVKIAPDLSDEAIAEVVELVCDLGLAGIVATNTTISREGLHTSPGQVSAMGEGGLSGKPLSRRSLEVLSVIRQTLPREYCVISVGGVFTGEDAQRLLEQGATLIQAYTGFVYRGPFFARKVLEEMGGSR
jgi:dihydroorotate dehydrogenase